MRIVQARLQRVRLPLVHEFQTSSHTKGALEHLLVRLVSDDGLVAWGEIASPSGPFYGAETTDTCWLIARDHLLPRLVGAEWDTPEEAAGLWRGVRGNRFAKAGVDAAVWALHAAANGVSLSQDLGGTATEVVAGVSLGIEPTIDGLLEQVAAHIASGYPRVKLKIAPGWDVEPVRAVRAAFGPDLDLHVDANGAYREEPDHLAALVALDEHRLTMIEQPFAPDDLLAHARLQARIETPVCLDESVESVDDLHTALALGAGRILNIKVSRMGGLTPARAAHAVALDAGMPVWCGGMHEFGVGRAANLAIASLPGFVLPSDVSGSDKYYARDVTTEPIRALQGRVAVPASPGLGYDVDEEFTASNTVDVVVLGDASAEASAVPLATRA
ncbi:o-succinylbenzoate synthase [Agromyces protaetiae]|uniref:o-succinylbenzoate synthase n=1 Tax=Agromyces protaetiae TaxID=2509455 RepID=A0A4P6FCV6_9MICO|nr:o-succinylbenzoate synthase [Agromyces protaetiae]QAY73506.1 o-succinylbenzoate synthase [Agromyces protaetiae]